MSRLSLLLLAAMALPASAQTSVFHLQGTVRTANGKGIAHVVVNDGIHFTTTDSQGRWALDCDTCLGKFVAISTPAEYEINNDNGLARFYIPVSKAVTSQSNDFVLQRRKAPANRFTYLAISDPQVRNEKEMGRWKNETVSDLRHTIDSLKSSGPVIGMTLGDLVFDTPWLFPAYAASCQGLGMTVFQTIGNHDFDKRYQDLHNMRYGAPVAAEHNYFHYFGPTNYSFNMGKVHVITMKNINYAGNKKYMEHMTDEEIAWIEKDLSYVPKGSIVFLNMHAPAWNTVLPDGNIRSAEALRQALKGYRVHVFCGHTHFFQNIIVSDSLYQHNINAACGAWWAGNVGQSGAPNGYLIVNVDGDNVKWHFKPTGMPVDNQMRLYAPGEFRRDRKHLVANVWDYDSKCSVTWSEDGVDKGAMEQFTATDEAYIRMQNAVYRDVDEMPTAHLFRCQPGKNAKKVTVTFTNHFGEKYENTIDL